MKRKMLQVLIIEDNPYDAEFLQLTLRRSGMKLNAVVVCGENEFRAALEEHSFDIILSDHALPQFSSLHALELVRDKSLQIPFILVTGAVSEEFAVKVMQMGADDYLLKSNLSRLPAAIQNAIERRKMQEDKEMAEQALRLREMNYRILVEQASDGIFIADQLGNLVEVNHSACKLTGLNKKELLEQTFENLLPADDRLQLRQYLQKLKIGRTIIAETQIRQRKEGEVFVEISAKMLPDGRIQIFARDISRRKKDEQELKKSRAQLRELAAHLQDVREEERMGIAREIHDDLGQQLTVLKMDATWLDNRLNNSEPDVKERLKSFMDLVDSTVKRVRRLATDLRPPVLDDFGLGAAIEWHLAEFQKHFGIKAFFVSALGNLEFPDAIKIALFRVLQESLTNVARHAEAKEVKVNLEIRNRKLRLTISDDGNGYDEQLASGKKTLGIVGMKERILMLGGEYVISGQPGQGTVTEVTVPLQLN